MRMRSCLSGLIGIVSLIVACHTVSLHVAEATSTDADGSASSIANANVGESATGTLSLEERLFRVREAIRRSNLKWKAEITEAAKLDADRPVALADVGTYPCGTENAAVKLVVLADIPESFDWREHRGGDWTTPAKNQGPCGACWAFVAVAIVETQMNIFADNPDLNLDLSEQELISYLGDSGCGGGSEIDALNYIREKGIVDEGCLPYRADDQLYPFCGDADQRRQQIAQVLRIEGSKPMTAEEIKGALVTRGPVGILIGAKVRDDFKFYAGGIYEPTDTEPSLGAHLLLLVGYDDDESCWVIKNSWGRTWGEDGFGRLRYGLCDVEQNAYLAGAEVSSLNLKDSDGDGFYDTATGGDDHDDSNADIHPGGEYQVFYRDFMTDPEWRRIDKPIRAVSTEIGVLDVSAGRMRFYYVMATNPLLRDEDGDGLPDSWKSVPDLRPIRYEEEVGLIWTAVPPSDGITSDARDP